MGGCDVCAAGLEPNNGIPVITKGREMTELMTEQVEAHPPEVDGANSGAAE